MIDKHFGQFYRRVTLGSRDATAHADVEDNEHRFGADVVHDGDRVTHVAGRALRTPWTTCPQAAAQLKKLIGCPLLTSPYQVLRYIELAQQCTHMIDMAALAVSAAARSIPQRRYDAVLAVEDRAQSDWRSGTLQRDQEPPVCWVVKDGCVVEPARYGGFEMKRSARWFEHQVADLDEIEAVFVMQRAMLVAGGRRVDLDRHTSPADGSWKAGACYAFQESRLHEGQRLRGSTRAFSHVDQLLTDIKPHQR